MEITKEFKQKVLDALMEARQNFTGNDGIFAHQHRINASVFSRLKNGEIDGLLDDGLGVLHQRIVDENGGDEYLEYYLEYLHKK